MQKFKSYFYGQRREDTYAVPFNRYLSRVFLWLASWFVILYGSSFLANYFKLAHYVLMEPVIYLFSFLLYISFSFFFNTKISKMRTEIAAALFVLSAIVDGILLSPFSAIGAEIVLMPSILSCAAICLFTALYIRLLDSEVGTFELFLVIAIFGHLILGALIYFTGAGLFNLSGTVSLDLARIREVFDSYGGTTYSENAVISSALKISIDFFMIAILIARFFTNNNRYTYLGEEEDDEDDYDFF